MSNLQPHELYPTRFLCPWNFSGKNTEVGCHFLLQFAIFLTQGSNACLMLDRFFTTDHLGSPYSWFRSVQSLSRVWLFATPWIAARQAVHHQLPEFTQTHVHQVSDAIQLSHPLSSPSPPAANPSQHQSLFQWVNSAWGGQSTGLSASASFLPKKSQGWSPSEWTGWISLQSKGLSRVFSNTTVQ